MLGGTPVLAAATAIGLSCMAAGACSSGKTSAEQASPGSGSAQTPAGSALGTPASGSSASAGGSQASAAVAAGSAAGSAGTAAGSAAPAGSPVASELVTGGSFGLAVIDGSGKVTRRLSKTPTSHPRWTADHKALVFLAESGELRRLELASRKESVIGKLPATLAPCAGKTIDRTALSIQADEDFGFENGGGAICIRLQDRNINMADVIVSFRVELATGKVTPTIEMSECSHEPGDMPQGCHGELPEHAARQKESAKPFAISDGVLTHGKSRRKLGRPSDYHEEQVSPSGKWSIVGGNLSNGDYIERDLFLLDRDTGKLYPLPRSARTWPRPIPERDLGKLQRWSGRTVMVVGETTILWLGKEDSVAIGQLLVVPGASIAHFDGDLAR
jgi:hypothetical protein